MESPPQSPPRSPSPETIEPKSVWPENHGAQGLIGFVIKGERKATFNGIHSDPQILGNQIADFIMRLSKDEIRQMQGKIEQLNWIPGTTGSVRSDNLDLLERIMNDYQTQIVDNTDFLHKKACKFAYFIDFDTRRVDLLDGPGGKTMVWMFEELAVNCFMVFEEFIGGGQMAAGTGAGR